MKTKFHENGGMARTSLRPVSGARMSSWETGQEGHTSVLTQLIAEWIPQSVSSTVRGTELTGRSADTWLGQLGFAVHMLLDQYLDESAVPEAIAAYDAGLHERCCAQNELAIEEAGRSGRAMDNVGNMETSFHALIIEMHAIGRLHGQMVRSNFSDDLAISRRSGTSH